MYAIFLGSCVVEFSLKGVVFESWIIKLGSFGVDSLL